MGTLVELTAAERVLLHLHSFWNIREPGREATQAGIAEGARLLRSHVPRTLKGLQGEGFVDSRDARFLGRTRKVRVYGLTEAGVRRARLGIRRGRPPLRVDGGRARRRSRVVRRLPRTLDGRTGLGPGPGGVRRRRAHACLRGREEAPRAGWLRGRRRAGRRRARRFPSRISGSRQAPRACARIDPGVLPFLLEIRRRRGTRRG